jgi:hypothetical protein
LIALPAGLSNITTDGYPAKPMSRGSAADAPGAPAWTLTFLGIVLGVLRGTAIFAGFLAEERGSALM